MDHQSNNRRLLLKGLAILPLVAVVAAVLVFVLSGDSSKTPAAEAAGPDPGMKLNVSGVNITCDSMTNPTKCTAGINQSFQLLVQPNPLPGVDISGYQSEVVMGGLIRTAKSCQTEDQTTVDGGNPASCTSQVGSPNTIRHVIASAIQAPPLPALDTPIPTLLIINVACPAGAGTNGIILRATPDEPFGGQYFDTSANSILLKTQSPGIADTLNINCVAPPSATATNTRTPTATNTPTRTPTRTPTPTVSATPTLTATPTPLPSELPDVTVSKTDSPDPVDANGKLTYTITVRNIGLLPATGVLVADTLPAGTTFNSAPGCGHNAGIVLCFIGDLAANDNSPGGPDEAVRTISVFAPTPDTEIRINNFVSVTATNEPFANSGNNKDKEETVVLAPRSDVTIDKSDLGTDPVGSSGNISYTLTVTNIGPQTATNVVITDTLPPGVVFKSAGAPCGAPVAGVVTCNMGDLVSGGQVSVKITVNAPVAVQDLLLKNSARVTADNEAFAQTGNNLDIENTAVIAPAPDLALVKTDSQDPVKRVQPYQYILTITNIGGGAAKNVHVTDILPKATTSGGPQPVVFLNAKGADCEMTAPNTIECDVPLVPAGGQVVITLNVRAPTVKEDQLLTNTASVVDPDEPEDPQGNNSDSETTLIDACFDVTGDNAISGLDFFALLQAFGGVAPNPPYSILLDINGDGGIASVDFFRVLQQFGQTCPKA